MSNIAELAEAAAEAKAELRQRTTASIAARNAVVEAERREAEAGDAYQKAKAALLRELA